MRSRSPAALWMVIAFGVALSVAVLVLAILGTDKRGTDAALFLTGRVSFLFFWPAYTGGAIARLFGPAFQPLKQHTREFGLAFASAHLVHLGLVAWLSWIGAAPSVSTFVFFGIAAAWTYALALFSLGRLQGAVGRYGWWLLRTVGLNYIAYAFAVDFINSPLGGGPRHIIAYLPFAVLSVGGPILRIIDYMSRLSTRRLPQRGEV